MCNRLWELLPSYLFAREHDSELYVLFPERAYLNCFPKSGNNQFLHFVMTDWHFGRKILVFLIKQVSSLGLEVTGDLSRAVCNHRRIEFIDGWNHRNDRFSIRDEYKKEFLETFSFSPAVEERVHKEMSGYEGKTIGLHIRRGDYQKWRNGRYCFEDSVWSRLMYTLKGELALKGEDCRFLICSNEHFHFTEPDLNIFQLNDADGITDLCALSHCDYIIGPPSTYSQWASFYRDVPMTFLLSPAGAASISIRDFSPIVRQNFFKNGKMLEDNREAGFRIIPSQ